LKRERVTGFDGSANLTIKPEVILLLQSSERIIRHKVGLLNLAEELGNFSQACKAMGMSRDTFYRYRDAVENGGVKALPDKSRRQANLKNRVGEATENAALTSGRVGDEKRCSDI
jgi:ACT domain-containing protein